MTNSTRPTAGLIYGLAAFGLWGVMPLYFYLVKEVRPAELLSHRIVWSVALLAVLITARRQWAEVYACLQQPRTRALLMASTVFIASNWFIFIYGVWSAQVVQNSLGYFINPFLSILLGMIFFRERLRGAQWVSLGFAAAGIVYLVVATGEVPGIALLLASSFALYGLIRKVAPVESLVGLTVETLFLFPLGISALAFWAVRGELGLGTLGPARDLAVVASGVVTAVPLLCFGAAARRLPLTVMGFLQYLAPSLQFLIAVAVLGEPFRPEQQVAFPLIWTALLIATLDGIYANRARFIQARVPVALPDRTGSLEDPLQLR